MRPTTEYLLMKFSELNNLCFGGKLPPVALKTSRTRRRMGAFVRKRKRVAPFFRLEEEVWIEISACYDLESETLDDILLHEMIHYHIWTNSLKDTSPHGKLFRSIASELNNRYGRNITVSHNLTESEYQSAPRPVIVSVATFNDGSKGFTAISPGSLHRIQKAFSRHPAISSVKWYLSRDPWFNRYPRCRTPKLFPLTPEDEATHITPSTSCIYTENGLLRNTCN